MTDFRARMIGLAALTALAAGLGGCEAVDGPYDYRDAHPIRVSQDLASHTLSFAPRDPARVIGDELRLEAFIADYLRRGRGPLSVLYARGGDARLSAARRQVVTTLLVRAGISADRIVLDGGAVPSAAPDAFVLSYRRYVARVPECGDWSGHDGYNPSNRVHTDFGCSYQRNIGLMLADPGDLVRPREAGPIDAQRTDRAIDTYRKGDPAGAQKPRSESGEISDVK